MYASKSLEVRHRLSSFLHDIQNVLNMVFIYFEVTFVPHFSSTQLECATATKMLLQLVQYNYLNIHIIY